MNYTAVIVLVLFFAALGWVTHLCRTWEPPGEQHAPSGRRVTWWAVWAYTELDARWIKFEARRGRHMGACPMREESLAVAPTLTDEDWDGIWDVFARLDHMGEM